LHQAVHCGKVKGWF